MDIVLKKIWKKNFLCINPNIFLSFIAFVGNPTYIKIGLYYIAIVRQLLISHMP